MSAMPSVFVCWKWTPHRGYRSTFTAQAVNALGRMLARHYPRPHKLICVTDDYAGIDASIEVLPHWNDFADIPSPHGQKNPSCYRRLRMFAPDAGASFGPHFVSIDLDTVITGDLTPLFDRPEDFVIWGDYTNPLTPYNGSLMMLRAGARPEVWTDFDPRLSPDQAKRAGFWGSDQGWISFKVRDAATWNKTHGVYSYRNDVKPKHGELPTDARLVAFHGNVDPWMPEAQALPWVREAWGIAA